MRFIEIITATKLMCLWSTFSTVYKHKWGMRAKNKSVNVWRGAEKSSVLCYLNFFVQCKEIKEGFAFATLVRSFRFVTHKLWRLMMISRLWRVYLSKLMKIQRFQIKIENSIVLHCSTFSLIKWKTNEWEWKNRKLEN